jgi:aromatic-L-amino-acid decarboxylase
VSTGSINRLGDTTHLVAYATSQAHSSIEKGLRIAGIGTDQHCGSSRTTISSRCVPTRSPSMVAADLAAGLTPFWVCCSRGTTSSMAFDPTSAIAPIAHEHDMWVHVDAAMSGIAALAPELRWVNDGLDQADSYCTNPHKWMGVVFDCDLFYTADRAALLGALSILPGVPAVEGRRVGCGDRLPRLADPARTSVPCAEAVVHDPHGWRDRSGRHDPPPRRPPPRRSPIWVRADERFEVVAPHPLNLLCLALRVRRRGDRRARRAGERHWARRCSPGPCSTAAARCACRSVVARPTNTTCAPPGSCCSRRSDAIAHGVARAASRRFTAATPHGVVIPSHRGAP